MILPISRKLVTIENYMQHIGDYIYKNVYVVLNMLIIGLILLLVSSLSLAKENEDYTAYAKKQEQKAKILIAPYKDEVNEIVKRAEKRQAQPDIKKIKKEIQNIAKKQCPNQNQGYQKIENKEIKQASLPIIIFVSFSMPKESIKGWIKQARAINASIYIRGLVNNSFKDTAIVISELVQDNKGGLLIDPTLFKKYSVAQVPAIVLAKDDNYDVIYGDVSLDYALEKISNGLPEAERKEVSEAIKQLRNTTKNV